MATAAETSSLHSPRGGGGFSGEHRRVGSLPPPWALPSPAEQTNFRDCSANSNIELKSNAGESKPAWSKPSNGNGVVESPTPTVMGAVSWPPLSRDSPKSSPDSSLHGSVSTTQAPVIPLSHDKNAATASTIPNSSTNHVLPVQQRYTKRGGGNSSQTGGGHSHSGFTRPPPPPPPPPFPIFQLPPSSYGTLVPPLPNSSPREPSYRAGNWETRPITGFVPQLHIVNDHRNNSRRGNYGPRGDGSYHNNLGSRRDHMPPQRGNTRSIVRAPPLAPHNIAPFINPQIARPFLTPIGFPDVTSQLGYYPQLPSFRGVPFIAPQHPPYFIPPPPEKPLHVRLLDQIEFYFSDANLIKDDFLKSKMDDQGWVLIALIAGFPRVKGLTSNVQLIIDSLRNSTFIEVQDEKLRRRDEWMKWIPNSGHLPTESVPSSSGAANYNMLATSFSNMTVEEMKSERGDVSVDAVAGTSAGSAHQERLSNGGDVCL